MVSGLTASPGPAIEGNALVLKHVEQLLREGRRSGDPHELQGPADPHATDAAVPLHGPDGVALNLGAQSSVSSGELVTTFGAVPDAAVSSFKLHINGGAKGILVVTGSKTLCHTKDVASVAETAQSGKRQTPDVQIATPCGNHKHAKRSRKHRARSH